MYVLFSVLAILHRIFTSGILHVRRLLEISIHSASSRILFMLCVGYARAAKNETFELP